MYDQILQKVTTRYSIHLSKMSHLNALWHAISTGSKYQCDADLLDFAE